MIKKQFSRISRFLQNNNRPPAFFRSRNHDTHLSPGGRAPGSKKRCRKETYELACDVLNAS